jgi:Cof subfamily protein (haloacid dehalogenase superfamily)
LYRLIATDVDGTLLDENSRITELNMKALLECKKHGIGIVLATGKTLDSIKHLVESMALKLPQIVLNGSIIITPEADIMHSIKIDKALYYEIIKLIKDNGYPPVVALDNGKLYLEGYHPDLRHLDNMGERFIRVESIESRFFAENAVDIFTPIKISNPLEGILRKKYSGKLQFTRSGEYFFDILNIEATKGNALISIINNLGIGRKEVVVFGDSPNDLSMFDIAGLRIAVKNSYAEVIKEADIITDENYKSGLGKAIFKYILTD